MAGSALMRTKRWSARFSTPSRRRPDHPGHPEIPHRLEPANRNAPTIARIAESAGVRAVAIHGRTRCQQYPARPSTTIAYVKT